MPRKITLDLADARALLTHVLAEAERLDGKETITDYDRGRTRVNDPEAAAISRSLQRMHDLCEAVSAEFSLAYWKYKGWEDPRDE